MGLGLGLAGGLAAAASRPAAPEPMYTPKQEPSYAYNPPPPEPAPPPPPPPPPPKPVSAPVPPPPPITEPPPQPAPVFTPPQPAFQWNGTGGIGGMDGFTMTPEQQTALNNSLAGSWNIRPANKGFENSSMLEVFTPEPPAAPPPPPAAPINAVGVGNIPIWDISSLNIPTWNMIGGMPTNTPPPTRQYYDVEEDAQIAQNKAAIGGRGGAGSYGNKWWDQSRYGVEDFAEGGLVNLLRRHMQKYQ